MLDGPIPVDTIDDVLFLEALLFTRPLEHPPFLVLLLLQRPLPSLLLLVPPPLPFKEDALP